MERFQKTSASSGFISRRAVLAGLGCLTIPVSASNAAADAPLRIASLDYALAETLIALGHPPDALSNAGDFQTWTGSDALPADTIDLGADLDVNLEVLTLMAPDLVLTTDYVSAQEPALSRIADVERLTIYAEGTAPLVAAEAITRRLGKRLGRDAVADAYLAHSMKTLDSLRERALRLQDRPVLLASFMDARHVRVYGGAGLYQNVLDRLGLRNAWTAPTSFWGFSTVGIEALGAVGDAHFVTFDPLPPDALPTLAGSPIWTALPFVRSGAVTVLPPVLMFGAVPSAVRFASLLVPALEAA